MTTTLRNERGIALAVAVFALVVIGTLVGGTFFLGMQEQRVGWNAVKHGQAFAAAEDGAQLAVANWNTGTYNGLATGDSATFAGQLGNGSGWYRGAVMRLNDLMFLVRAEGFSPDSQTRHHMGLLVRLLPIEINIDAALKTQGDTKIGGSSYIDGHDTPPSGWSCGAAAPSQPGIRIADADDISTAGCQNLSCVDGDPKVLEDTTITDSVLTTFGDLTFDDLKAMATKVIPAGNYQNLGPTYNQDGSCNTAHTLNWGDPLDPSSACGNYFPVIFMEGESGNTILNTGSGQGILIVEGDLSVQGGFQFFGPVIVRGRLKTTGTGGHFNGGVIAANVDLEQNTVLGNAVISYSSCALTKALTASASGSLVRERSWINLY